jgi:hypothetical protein
LKDCSKEKREHRTDACVPQSLTQFSFIEKALLTSAMNKKKKKKHMPQRHVKLHKKNETAVSYFKLS